MILHFCEKCGNRVPQKQIDSGAAVIIEDVRALCVSCAGKRPSRRASQAQIAPPKGETALRKSSLHIVPEARKSGIQASPLPAEGSESHTASTPAHAAKAPADGASPSSKKILMYVGAGVGLLLIIVSVILLSSGEDKQNPTPKAPPPATTAVPPSTADAHPVGTALPPAIRSVEQGATVETAQPERLEDGYDPRAAVALSLLNEAKAKAGSDPTASRELFEKVRDTYVRTPAAEEAVKLLADWKPPAQLAPRGQTKPRLDGTADTFLLLSDVLSLRCGHTGRPLEGRSIDGRPMRIGKKSFDKGIGSHSPGELNFDFGAHYKWFSGYLGVDMECNGNGSVGFEIWLDGRKAYESGVLRGNEEARFFKLPVEGSRRVRIVITNGRDNDGADHADLCRLRLWIGPDEPKDEYAGAETSVATTTPPPAPEPKPEVAPSVPAPPAVSTETLAQQAYAQFLTGFWGALREKGWTVARSRLSDALKNPQLAGRAADLKADGEMLALIEKAWAAVPEGAALLKDGRAITLIESDSRRYTIGAGSKTRFVKTTATSIEIELDDGRGKLGMGISYARLSFESNRELAQAALPDDGGGRLALVLMDWLRPVIRNVEQADQEATKALSVAEKNKAPAQGVARMRAWLELSAKERTADGALKALEALIEQRKGKEALAAYESFKKDHLATAFWANLQPQLPALEEKLKPFRLMPGLWVSYWSGNDRNRFDTFHLARAEANLLRDFGGGSGEPQVPGDNFGLRMGGLLEIPAAGRYAFFGHSDDFMKVWLDGKLIIETDCSDRTAELDLKPGEHTFKVEFTECGGGAAMHIRWKPPGAADWQPIPAELLQHIADRKDEYQKP